MRSADRLATVRSRLEAEVIPRVDDSPWALCTEGRYCPEAVAASGLGMQRPETRTPGSTCSAAANRQIVRSVTFRLPASQLLTYVLSSPATAASASCERPRSRRSVRKRWAKPRLSLIHISEPTRL